MEKTEEKIVHEHWTCDWCEIPMSKPVAKIDASRVCRHCAEGYMSDLEAFIELSDEGMVVNDGIRFQIQDAIRNIAKLKEILSKQ